MVEMTISEARAALPEILDRVLEGEEVTITRHGRPVAVVVHYETLRGRRRTSVHDIAERLHDQVLGRAPVAASAGLSAARAEELVRHVREGRDRR